jgi:hypothetical protein
MTMLSNLRRALSTAAAAALLVPAAATAQSSPLGWSPWIGCWQAEGAPEDAAALCVRPAGSVDGAVEILRVEDGQAVEREIVWADGTRHETVRDGCIGWEEGIFSADGQRVLLNSSHTCDDGSVQRAGGIMALSTPDQWLDVRFVEVGGEATAWVQRYDPAPLEVWEAMDMEELAPDRAMRIRGARMAAARPADVEDVIEAGAVLPPEPVEAWIAEKGDPFRLDGETLLAMDDAGVADRVIDVVVAVSNPDVFALTADGSPERVRRDEELARRAGPGWLGFRDPFWFRPFGWDPFFGFRASPFGWNGWGGFGWAGGAWGGGWGYRPSVVVVDRRDGGRQLPGRVIAGQGYRGPRSSAGSGSGSSDRSSGSARPARRRGGESAAPSRTPSTSRPTSGSGRTPRKAKPRPKPKGGGGLLF